MSRPRTAPRRSSAARLGRLPADLVRRSADYTDGRGCLALHLATGRAAPLAPAFRAANELRRLEGDDDDAAVFRRWEALAVPLRVVVVEMDRTMFESLFKGAARRGVAALSALDASRLDLDLARQQRGAMSMDQMLDKAWERVRHVDGLPEGFSREDLREGITSNMVGTLGSVEAQFDGALAKVLLDQEVRTYHDPAAAGGFEGDSPECAWLSRHAQFAGRMPGVDGAYNVAIAQLLVDTTAMMHEFMRNPEGRAPRLGDPDVADVYETEWHQPVMAVAAHGDAATAVCRRCDAGRPVTHGCPLCAFACCASCHAAMPGAAADGDEFRFHACACRSGHTAINMDCMNFMQELLQTFGDCDARIDSERRLAANVALQKRILAQRDWLAGVAEDRKVARAMIARGPIAHEAWLAAKYAANPFNGARPPALGDSSPLFDYGR